MTKTMFFTAAVLFLAVAAAGAEPAKEILPTAAGDLEITFLGHASLMFRFAGKIIQVDPFGQVADYDKLPRADLVLITHEHFDHLDPKALKKTRGKDCVVILPAQCAAKVDGGTVITNGEVRTWNGITVAAVPAYNIVNRRDNGRGNGQPYHPKGQGNGYVLTFGDKRVYIAGDTENTPEMKALAKIGCAFLPMNLPYTMSPEMVADAARAFKPRILYPYHYGETDPSQLVELLKNADGIEVRIREMK